MGKDIRFKLVLPELSTYVGNSGRIPLLFLYKQSQTVWWAGFRNAVGYDSFLEKGMATRCSILAWEISWTEEPGGLQSMESQRIGHDLVTK